MSVVVGPMLLTTAGAIDSLDNFETVKMLTKRMNDIHDVKVFGTSHLSFYMGAGGKERMIAPGDFSGKKIRSMGPAENAMLGAFGANPTTMAFGDVPPALETGVIDGLLTSLGGFNVVKEQAPFFTVAGINGIVGDYYWIGASNKWWSKLDADYRRHHHRRNAADLQAAQLLQRQDARRQVRHGRSFQAWYLRDEVGRVIGTGLEAWFRDV